MALVDRGALTAGEDGVLRHWDLETGQERHRLAGHVGEVTSIVLVGEGGQALSAGVDRSVRAWDLAEGTPRGRAMLQAPVRGLALRKDETVLAASGHSLYVLSVLARVRPLPPLALCRPVTAIEAGTREDEFQGRLAEARRLLEAGDTRGALREARALREIPGYERSRVSALAVSPDGRFAVSGSWDGTVRAWDLATREAVIVLGGDAGPVSAVAIGPDARQVVSGHQDGAIRLWNLKLRSARVLTAHTSAQRVPDRVVRLAVSTDPPVSEDRPRVYVTKGPQ